MHPYPQMPPFTAAERDAFLGLPGVARLSSLNPDGSIHTVPVLFRFDGRDIVIGTQLVTRKVRNIERTGQAAISVDMPHQPYGFATIEGTVTIDRDPASSRRWATEMGRRYMGEDRAEEFGRRNGIEGEWVFRLTPTSWTGVADMTGS